MIISFSRTLLTTKIGGNVITFGFKNVGIPIGPPVSLKFARKYFAISPNQMFIRFGFAPRGTVVPTPVVKVIDTHDGVTKKKKKKQRTFEEEIERTERIKKQIHEVIYPVTPQEPEPEIEPKTEPEVARARIPLEIKTDIAPSVDYAGLAKEEILDKLKIETAAKAAQKAKEAIAKAQEEQHRLELKRLADIEDEEELEMILEALL